MGFPRIIFDKHDSIRIHTYIHKPRIAFAIRTILPRRLEFLAQVFPQRQLRVLIGRSALISVNWRKVIIPEVRFAQPLHEFLKQVCLLIYWKICWGQDYLNSPFEVAHWNRSRSDIILQNPLDIGLCDPLTLRGQIMRKKLVRGYLRTHVSSVTFACSDSSFRCFPFFYLKRFST